MSMPIRENRTFKFIISYFHKAQESLGIEWNISGDYVPVTRNQITECAKKVDAFRKLHKFFSSIHRGGRKMVKKKTD